MKKKYKILLIISLKLSNFLYKLISFFSIKYEGGIHPKHRLIGYHKFFTDNILESDSVLDIGCGNGALAYDVARKAKKVIGIDIMPNNILRARKMYFRDNMEYIIGDATKGLNGEKFDVIILSNVLEHIEKRGVFLEQIKGLAGKYLIRVPMFDRDWVPLYKKEMGVEWRLDRTHFIEYTEVSFREEIENAGYTIDKINIQFGEIWAVII